MVAFVFILLIVAFILARLMRSTTMWWAYVLTILVGLLCGLLCATTFSNKKENKDAIALLKSTKNMCNDCSIQLIAAAISRPEIVGQNDCCTYVLRDKLDGYNTMLTPNTRNPPLPEIINDS